MKNPHLLRSIATPAGVRRMRLLGSVLLAAATLSGASTCVAAEKEKPVPDLHVTGSHLEENVRCHRNALFLRTDNSRITVEGDCTTVHIEGTGNWVEVQYADWIRTGGTLNSVLYLNPRTQIWTSGKGNSVAPKWQQ